LFQRGILGDDGVSSRWPEDSVQATTTLAERKAPVRQMLAGRLLLAVQLYAAGTYLITTVAQYGLFRGAEPWLTGALSAEGAANPLAILFVVPGYYITLLSGPVFALAALWGAATTAARWAHLNTRSRTWSIAATALCVALFIFGLTPVGRDMAVWVAG
jgi:hypothetical protein